MLWRAKPHAPARHNDNAYMDKYYQSEEFLQLLARYEEALDSHAAIYLEVDEFADIIQYYATLGQNDKATQAADMALELHPGALEPWAYKARYAMIIDGDTRKADWCAEQIADKADNDYYYLKAEILIQRDELEKMQNYLMARFDELDQEDKDDFALDVADMLNDYRITEYALVWLNAVSDKATADYKTIKADSLIHSDIQDRDGEGEKLLEELTNEDPYNVEHWISLADAQRLKGDYEESANSCDYALAIDPKSDEALSLKGDVLICMEKYEAAAALFKRYYDTCETDRKATAAARVGLCLVAMNEYEQAQSWFIRGFDDTTEKAALFISIFVTIADGCLNENTYKILKEIFVSLGDENNSGWAHMALISLSMNRMDDFQHYLQEAILRTPREAKTMLGEFYPAGSSLAEWPYLTPRQNTNG